MAKNNRQPLANPAASGNIFSRFVSQSWLNDLFKKGHKQSLDDSDIGEVLHRDSTEYLTDKLQRYWDHEVKTSKNPNLVMPFIKLAGIRYISLIIYIVLELSVRIVQPVFIGKIVGVFQDGSQGESDGYLYATIIMLCAFTEAILHHPLFLELLRTGMNLRVAVSALVYRKALRMSQASLSLTNTGQVVNLVTTDVQKLEEATLFVLYLFVAPFLIPVSCYLIWVEIGYSFIPGIGLLFLLTPLQGFLGRFFAALRSKTAILRDERIKIMSEVICGMRVIKMYTWEHPFARLIGEVRRKEISQILKTSRLYSANASFYSAAIPMVTMAMFVPYVLTGNTLSIEKVFTVIAIVASINVVTTIFVPKSIAALRENGVSIRRIEIFLQMTEGQKLSLIEAKDGDKPSVSIKNMYSSWDEGRDETLSDVTFDVSAGELLMVVGPVGCGKSSLLMALLHELPLRSGDIRLCGTVAYVSQQPWVFSGTLKENILFGKKYDKEKYDEVISVCALEKDLESLAHGDETVVGERGVSLSGGQKARVNLARAVYLDASIYIMDDPLSAVDSHVARHIFDKCIRDKLQSKVKILVSHQLQFLGECDRILCLQQGKVVGYGDLKYLQESKIDILSMIQVEEEEDNDEDTAPGKNNKAPEQEHDFSRPKLQRHFSHSPTRRKKYIFSRKEHDTRSLYGETGILLADNELNLNDQYRAKSANDLGRNPNIPATTFRPRSPTFGGVATYHTKQRTTSYRSFCTSQMDLEPMDWEDIISQEDEEELGEIRSTGSITFKVYKDYFLAGARPAFIFLAIVIFLSAQVFVLLSEWWLAHWSNWEESSVNKNQSQSIIEEKRTGNILIYACLVGSCLLLSFTRAVILFNILINASRHLHDKMFKAILRAPIYFFDTNPAGRILNRFSKDIGLIDDILPSVFFDAAQLSILALSIILMSIVAQPYSSIAIVPILIIFIWLRQYYIKTSRDIKRLEALTRSPLYSHICATLQGLTTIRASGEEQQFIDVYNDYQDLNSSAWFYYLCANRWLGFRLDVLCATFMVIVAFAPFLASEAGLSVSPVLVGLSLIYAKRLNGMFQFCVRQSAEVENQMVSVERIQEYTRTKPEAELEVPEKKPPENWPEHGAISGEHVRFRYNSSLPVVLKDVTFNIKAKEKVGIVGRTGAGKSSLISMFFRMAEPFGVLKIDGVSITDIGLHDLRGRLSIIPQDPIIFGGTVRSNLDPFANHKDVDLWNALEQVQLKEVVNNFREKLEFLLTESGSNLSVGQRQLICLARAILKHNKILIIDEATANVDYKTDHLIQETIRSKFKDCTVLTIAHRLNTIMDSDRIMVLDAGNIIEFDEPYELLKCTDSEFSNLVAQTGAENSLQLQKMARVAHEKRTI